jgi:hypothetical protein
MSDYQVSKLPERNPITHARHRREVFWQITIPLVAGILLLLVPAVAATLATPQGQSRWADISIIWLSVPALFFGLIFLIILSALAYAIFWVVRVLPVYARKLQNIFVTIGAYVRLIDNKLVEPFLRARSASASARALRRQFRR